ASEINLPKDYLEPDSKNLKKYARTERAKQPEVEKTERCSSFVEVEQSFILEDALSEAGRCMRCDLEFSKKNSEDAQLESAQVKEEQHGNS
ncbi:hypothetical protein ACFL7D_10070, partial [candidate division KSB1 bacterium]